MAFIHHHQGIIALSEIANFANLSHIAVHRKDPIRYNDFEAVLGLNSLLQLHLQIFHIIVGIPITRCFAEAHAIDDGGMIQCVGNDRIFGAQQRLKNTPVGVKCCRIKDGVFGLVKFSDALFQPLVNVLCSADESNA